MHNIYSFKRVHAIKIPPILVYTVFALKVFRLQGLIMKMLSCESIYFVSGGKELLDSEATNAYMMAGSMFFPVIGLSAFRAWYPSISSGSVIGTLAEASIIAAGTGIGVWVGYQIYYAVYYYTSGQ